MPSVGRIERVRFPQGPGVRTDGGVYRGYDIPLFYDSLLAKLVTWGRDRDEARRRMLRALGEIVLDGPRHNVGFHKWLCAHPEFAAGRLSTRFLEEHFTPAVLHAGPEMNEVALLAAALHAHEERQRVAVVRREGNRSGDSSVWKWRGRERGGR